MLRNLPETESQKNSPLGPGVSQMKDEEGEGEGHVGDSHHEAQRGPGAGHQEGPQHVAQVGHHAPDQEHHPHNELSICINLIAAPILYRRLKNMT